MKLSTKNSTIIINCEYSGIGKEIAKLLVDDAKQIIIVTHNEERLSKLANKLKFINPAQNVPT